MVEKTNYTPKTAEEYIKFDKAMRHSLEPNEIKTIISEIKPIIKEDDDVED